MIAGPRFWRTPAHWSRKKANEAGELKEHLELIGKEAADHYEILMAQMRETAETMMLPAAVAGLLEFHVTGLEFA